MGPMVIISWRGGLNQLRADRYPKRKRRISEVKDVGDGTEVLEGEQVIEFYLYDTLSLLAPEFFLPRNTTAHYFCNLLRGLDSGIA